MTSNHQRRGAGIACLVLLATIGLSSCGSQLQLSAPLCLERDFVLQPVSVTDQRVLRDASPVAFEVLANNDLLLKSYLREIEAVVAAHDARLGGCDQS